MEVTVNHIGDGAGRRWLDGQGQLRNPTIGKLAEVKNHNAAVIGGRTLADSIAQGQN